jgi:TetR/AcrR family transcriptional regulator, tetracycline repressor protein
VVGHQRRRRPGGQGRLGSGRAGLDRAQIVAAAVRIIDTEGVGGLSMRRLAVELDSGVMSVYRHVRDRTELVDLAFDAAMAEIESPPANTAWDEALVAAGRQLRAVLARHPNFVQLIGARPALGPHGLALLETLLGILRGVGISDVEAYRATSAVVSYVVGQAVLQVIPAPGPTEQGDRHYQPLLDAFVRGLPAAEYPSLTSLVPQLTTAQDAEDFEYGLRAVITGIRLGRAGP